MVAWQLRALKHKFVQIFLVFFARFNHMLSKMFVLEYPRSV